tara:strand:+ start:2467 stop:2931 length:465 start_codon:yes stop_codon:yes gene_type:complete
MEPPIEEDIPVEEQSIESIEKPPIVKKKPRTALQLAAFEKCQAQRKIKIAERTSTGVSKQKSLRIKKDDMLELQEATINKQKALLETYEDVQTKVKPVKKVKKGKKKPLTPPPSSSDESESEEEPPFLQEQRKSRTPKKAQVAQQPATYHIQFV